MHPRSVFCFYIIFYPLNYWLKSHDYYNLADVPVLNRITTRNEDADSIIWRQALIRESTPIIEARKFLGYGFGTFPLVWEENRNLVHQWDDSAEAHNDYLRITLELGLTGLVVYLLFLLALTKKSFALLKINKQKYLYIFAWITVFIALSLTDNMLHHTPVMWLMWAWLGAVFVQSNEHPRI